MSKQTIWAIVALIILFAVLGGAYLSTKKMPQALIHTQETAPLLYIEDGEVSYTNGVSLVLEKATTSPVVLSEGSIVHTEVGRASILFPNNSSITVDEHTELVVRYNENKVSLYQTLGTTYHRVEALVTGATYEVATPGTVASVRGTKFAVKYDKVTKNTKVSVTEHAVLVAKVKDEGGIQQTVESFVIQEGKTARVDSNTSQTGTVKVIDTNTDTEMKLWVEKNKRQDDTQKSLKEEGKTQEEIRTEIKVLLKDTLPDQSATDTQREVEEKKGEVRDASPKPEEKKDLSSKPPEIKTTERKPAPPADVSGSGSVVVKKLDQETFFGRFNSMFIDYFYIDDTNTACQLKISPSERVRVVTEFAVSSGYPFSSKTLSSFASAIDSYCIHKEEAMKGELQRRFDIEFPYNENI